MVTFSINNICYFPDPSLISVCVCFDHIWGMVFTCTHRNLDIHTPVHKINITVPVSDNIFGQQRRRELFF